MTRCDLCHYTAGINIRLDPEGRQLDVWICKRCTRDLTQAGNFVAMYQEQKTIVEEMKQRELELAKLKKEGKI